MSEEKKVEQKVVKQKAVVASTKTVVKRCTCKSEFQDKMYGQGMRVMNTTGGKTSTTAARCTVCGQVVN